MDLQSQHDPGHRFRDGITDAYGVTYEQIPLQV